MNSKVVIPIFLIDLLWVVSIVSAQDGFCHNFAKMHQHCLGEQTVPMQRRVGKSGPKGEKGEKGRDAEVDNDMIQQSIDGKFEVLRDHLDGELAKCKRDLLEYRNKVDAIDERVNSTFFTNCRRVIAEDAKTRSGSGGVFDIYTQRNKLEVFCDLETDGGGWTVFQRRMDGSVNFYRGWDDYIHGFGNLTGEFWMGLETLHRITATSPHEMRVDLEAWDNEKRYAKYSTFSVGDLDSQYALRISGHSGTAADSISRENGRPFTTKDTTDHNCATLYKGAWWYGNCHEANLNGIYSKSGPESPYGIGLNWRHWKGYRYSMKYVEMKIRPLNL